MVDAAGSSVLIWSAIALTSLTIQVPAVAILLARLIKGPKRYPPLVPIPSSPNTAGKVSIVVPTLNEANRITPCLQGLAQQGNEVHEIIIVDSYSQDGTPDLVKAAAQRDPRFRLINDDPLPADWVGRPWALHNGFLNSSPDSEWILGIDADTQPRPGLVASIIHTAQQQQYDLLSLAPQFILKDLGEFWLQPSLLMTLIYRFGPSGTNSDPSRVMANGQCFLVRRSLLERLNGYSSACRSFCDDVTLARYAASQGARVGFLDGRNLIQVRMYEGAMETWREWGRSLDLKDASSRAQIWGDIWFLLAVQGLPLPMLAISTIMVLLGYGNPVLLATAGLNGFLVLVRTLLLVAIAPAYDFTQARSSWTFWLSPLSDPLAWLRITLSSLQTPRQWRGRQY